MSGRIKVAAGLELNTYVGMGACLDGWRRHADHERDAHTGGNSDRRQVFATRNKLHMKITTSRTFRHLN
jgi:hypothetical protein